MKRLCSNCRWADKREEWYCARPGNKRDTIITGAAIVMCSRMRDTLCKNGKLFQHRNWFLRLFGVE